MPFCGENFTPDDDADGCHIRKVNSERELYSKAYTIPRIMIAIAKGETVKLKFSVVAVETI